jgi:Putative lumazine-binding
MTDVHEADRKAITATALDYYEGWFDGDADRMTRALHPELAKRGIVPGGGLDTDTARTMIDATAAGVGRSRDVADRDIRIRVDDVHGDIATATITSAVYVDYVHLVRLDGRWQIVNALWARA